MNQNLNLNLLKYFYEAVNSKNITKASQRLLVSQPAITKAIRELENELNVKLLERSKKGVIPTTEGTILYNHIKNMFHNLNSTLNVIELTKGEGGHIHIGATTTNFLTLIMDVLKEFKSKYPKIQIHIILEEIHILSDMAKLGKLDIVIKNNYEKINDFSKIKSFESTDKFIASKKYYSELAKKEYSLKELLEFPFVLLTNITQGRQNFDNYLQSQNIDFKPTYEFNSYSLCHELIKNGFGIGVGNPMHYNDSDFVIINTNFNLPSRTFDIGYIKNSKNKFIPEFIKLINQ